MAATKSVKLKDIAERVGVSIVTVSKALAGKPGMTEELREEIKQVAQELGYKSYGKAAALKKKGTGNIGVLIPQKFSGPGSYYWELYQCIVTCLSEYGYYAIMEILDSEKEENLVLPNMIIDKKVDGVISLGQESERYVQELFLKSPKPIVCLDFYGSPNIDTVISDSFYGAYVLTKHLLDLGHREIGFVGTAFSTSSITDRYFGYLKAISEQGIRLDDRFVINDRVGLEGASEEMITLPDRMPTAFVCNCDTVAYMLIHKLNAIGFSVPDDISVVGYDNYASVDYAQMKLTTYDTGMKKMADIGVKTIINKISGEAYYKGIQIVTGNLVLGDSTKEHKRSRI